MLTLHATYHHKRATPGPKPYPNHVLLPAPPALLDFIAGRRYHVERVTGEMISETDPGFAIVLACYQQGGFL